MSVVAVVLTAVEGVRIVAYQGLAAGIVLVAAQEAVAVAVVVGGVAFAAALVAV